MYFICEALGYGNIGEELFSCRGFSELLKELNRTYKNERFLVVSGNDYIYFTGLQYNESLQRIKENHPLAKLNKQYLTERFKSDFYKYDYMYA